MIKEGEESYTTNLCQQCCNESLVARGDKPLTKRQWYEFVQKKGASWKVMENDGKRTVHERDVGISLPRKIKNKKVPRMLRKRGKQECRASGSMNRQPGVLGTVFPCFERRGLGKTRKHCQNCIESHGMAL